MHFQFGSKLKIPEKIWNLKYYLEIWNPISLNFTDRFPTNKNNRLTKGYFQAAATCRSPKLNNRELFRLLVYLSVLLFVRPCLKFPHFHLLLQNHHWTNFKGTKLSNRYKKD